MDLQGALDRHNAPAALTGLPEPDFSRERAFEALCRTAAAVLGAPMAFMMLASETGLRCETYVGMDGSLADAFCDNLSGCIGVGEILVVPDLRADERFASVVDTGSSPRFCVSVPLRSPLGPCGALCVIDTAPRHGIGEEIARQLKDLACVASVHLHLREADRKAEVETHDHALLAENTGDVIILADLDTTRRYVSPAARAVLGHEPSALIGTRPLDFVHPDDAEDYRRILDDLTHERVARATTCQRYLRKDGTWIWVEASFSLIRDPSTHQATGYLAVLRDISDRRAAEEARRISEERLALALDAGSDGLWDCDLVTGAVWSSDRWWQVLGYEPGELEAHARTWRALVHPEDATATDRVLQEHLSGRTAAYECEHRLRRKDGTWAWLQTRGRVVERTADGVPLRFVGTQIDISARKAAEGQIAHMARHDALTDLPNRMLFHERLAQKLAEVRRYGGSCALLCLDLDRFKAINDTLGHLAGDALLCTVAQRLRTNLRAEDTVARLGGDEFAILLGGASEPGSIAALADRLIAAVGEPVPFGEQRMEVGLSIGIALTPEHGVSAEELFKRADLALYRAKAEGRNAHRFFTPAMDELASERRDLERDLRSAIEAGELTLHYQPQVSTGSGALTGFEALVRWVHPTRGLISPASFIPIAEETGLILPLGEWVLRMACREAAQWTTDLKVAVNLSPRQFQQEDLAERVLSILAETGLSPGRLELEITETVIINDMARALGILRHLKRLGVRIAMDDFGTGYSSLATLQAFPFDKIKIDRSFVGHVGSNPQATVIVRAVLGLGRSLGISVVAEGVETTAQMRFLAEEACAEVQGYLLGKPQPIEQFADSIYAMRGAQARRQAPQVA